MDRAPGRQADVLVKVLVNGRGAARGVRRVSGSRPSRGCLGQAGVGRGTEARGTRSLRLVESAWGAVPGLLSVRFPRPLAEPAVRLSTQRALHGVCR